MTTISQPAATAATSTRTMVEALNEALDQAMERDSRVFVLGEDISDRTGGSFQVTKGLTTKYGEERVRDTPIAEQAIIGAAIGSSLAGMRPVAEIMLMDFLAVGMDQLVNHAAKLRYMSGGRTNVPVTIRVVVSGGRGFGAQHSQSLEVWLAHVPGLKVVVPSTPADAKGLLTSCIEDEDPCVFLESMDLMFQRGEVPTGEHRVPLGTADIKHPGNDVTVITYGRMVPLALSAAAALQEENIGVEVLDLRSLVPLDLDAVYQSVRKTGRAVVLHAATMAFGVGAEIAARLSSEFFGELRAPVARLGAKFAPNPVAPNLEKALYPDVAGIADAVRGTMAS